ncbi:MAG: alkaline phosphatase family protein [Thermodesulfovibrionales bacterium]
MKVKVFCIGLDGGTFDLIDQFIERGHLPNIKRLIENGTRATLNSVILPFTPQAWGSFMTGVNPGKHGVFGFKQKSDSDYSFQFVNNRSLKTKTLWNILSEMNKKVILINIPMMYPPEEGNGVLIGGMDSPGEDSNFTFPAEIKELLYKITKDYVIHLHVGAGYLDNDDKRRMAIDGLLKMIDAREKVVLYFMQNYPWNFFAVNFSATDQVQHHFWRYMRGDNEFKDAILTIYKRVDEAVGKIVNNLKDESILFIMSDHGAGPSSDIVFFLDEWLREKGLLNFKKVALITKIKRAIINFLLTFFSKKLASEIKDTLMHFSPGLRVRLQGYVRRSLIDWTTTKVFSGEHPATLRINLKGRDKEGIVDKKDYEDLRDYLIKELEKIKDPETGDKLIERVYRREELYKGPYLNTAPDLIICTKDFAHQIKGGPYPRRKTYKKVVSKKDPRDFFVNGVHRLNGLFIAYGKAIKKGLSLAPLSITDLYPTILYSMGLGVPKAVDGRVVTEIFNEDFMIKNPVKYIDYPIERDSKIPDITYEREEEEKEVAKALKGLGYID